MATSNGQQMFARTRVSILITASVVLVTLVLSALLTGWPISAFECEPEKPELTGTQIVMFQDLGMT